MEDVRSLNHIKWECKYHVVWDSEVSEEDIVRGVAEEFGFNVQRSRYAEGVPGNRRASVVGSYTHADIDATGDGRPSPRSTGYVWATTRKVIEERGAWQGNKDVD